MQHQQWHTLILRANLPLQKTVKMWWILLHALKVWKAAPPSGQTKISINSLQSTIKTEYKELHCSAKS